MQSLSRARALPTPFDDLDALSAPPRVPKATPFGSVWDRQLGTPVARPAAGLAPLPDDDEDLEEPAIPEVSANKYFLNIRFTNPPASDLRAKVAERDVPFALTFCNL